MQLLHVKEQLWQTPRTNEWACRIQICPGMPNKTKFLIWCQQFATHWGVWWTAGPALVLEENRTREMSKIYRIYSASRHHKEINSNIPDTVNSFAKICWVGMGRGNVYIQRKSQKCWTASRPCACGLVGQWRERRSSSSADQCNNMHYQLTSQ